MNEVITFDHSLISESMAAKKARALSDDDSWSDEYRAIVKGRHEHKAACTRQHSHADAQPYSTKDLEVAIWLSYQGHSIREAARQMGVPYTTLHDYVRPDGLMYGRDPGQHSYDRILTDDEERRLIETMCVVTVVGRHSLCVTAVDRCSRHL